MNHDTDQLESRLRSELAELADHALVSPDAWSRVEEQTARRRWTPILVPVAAAAAVVALVLAVMAILHAGDKQTVVDEPDVEPITLEATYLPSGFERAEFEDESHLACDRFVVRDGAAVCEEVIGSSTIGYRGPAPDDVELFVGVLLGTDDAGAIWSERLLDDPEGLLEENQRLRGDEITAEIPRFERVGVRGDADALLSEGEADLALMWREAPGVFASVDAYSHGDPMSVDELLRIAEGLRAVPLERSGLQLIVQRGMFAPEDVATPEELAQVPEQFLSLEWYLVAAEQDGRWCTLFDRSLPPAGYLEDFECSAPDELSVSTYGVGDVGFMYGTAPAETTAIELVESGSETRSIEPVELAGDASFPVRFYLVEIRGYEYPSELVARDTGGNELARVEVGSTPAPPPDEIEP